MTVINISPEILRNKVKQARDCQDCVAILDYNKYILEFCLAHCLAYEDMGVVIMSIECSLKWLFPEDYE